jgi:hypothetical protein
MGERITYTYGPVFNRLWAVVAYESIDTAGASGQRLLWSPEQQAWRRDYQYAHTGFSPKPTNAQPDAEYVASVVALLGTHEQRLERNESCPQCWLPRGTNFMYSAASELEEYNAARRDQFLVDHFVAPDVFGKPAMYCVQRPDKSVVASSRGSGEKKHWGSIWGCQAVEPEFFTDRWDGEHVYYGEGMVASDVRDRSWCSRCTGSADNIADQHRELDSAALHALAQHAERELLERRAANSKRRR